VGEAEERRGPKMDEEKSICAFLPSNKWRVR